MTAPPVVDGGRATRRRRWWFLPLLALLVLAVAELAGWTGWWLLTGSCFTWSRAAALRALAGDDPAAAATPEDAAAVIARRGVTYGYAVHPFLGFVAEPRERGEGKVPVSRFGFLDREPPIRQRGADRFVVGVVGGSVAAQLCLYAADALADELKKSPRLRDRSIDLVTLAHGGYKQPQQLIAVEYVGMLGGEFDAVIDLDGFNEVALVGENLPQVPGFYPRAWARLLDTPSREQELRIGRLAFLREQRGERAAGGAWLRWSALAQLWWLVGDRRLEQQIGALAAAVEHAAATPSFAITGPGAGGLDESGARAQMADVWEQCSLDLHAVCARRGIAYFHFLQPNQYVPGSKSIGAEEAAIAVHENNPFRAAVQEGYPLLQARAPALLAGGVRFVDLTGMFRDHPEPLYVDDCCHVNRAGYVLMARRIAATVRNALDLEGVELRALRAEPAQLHFASPVDLHRLTVVGTAADGRAFDVSEAAFGTAFELPAGLLAATADGRLRACRRGGGEVVVRRGGLAATVAVTADWPDVLVLDDGVPAAPGAPRLTVPAETRADATTVAGRCGGLPAAGMRLLVLGAQPVPALFPRDFTEVTGFATTDLPVAGAEVPVALPWPAGAATRDVPLFARVLVIDVDTRKVAAASNTVVLTRR
jgi:hypothetical protein